MNLSHVACAGARIPDVRANQLGALSAATNLATISIGGNDAGFSSVITRCPKPWPWTCTGDISNARNFITNTLPGQLDALYTEIDTRAPNAQVIIVGYPRLFNGEECNLGARISPDEQSALNGVADLLATKISAVAAAHGFDFVDARTPFSTHRICDDVEWLNGSPIRSASPIIPIGWATVSIEPTSNATGDVRAPVRARAPAVLSLPRGDPEPARARTAGPRSVTHPRVGLLRLGFRR